MNAPSPLKPAGEPFQLQPNMVLYQVLLPTTIVDAKGQAGITTAGPFTDLATASYYAQQRPGSLLAVLVILHQAPPLTRDQLQASTAPGAPPAG